MNPAHEQLLSQMGWAFLGVSALLVLFYLDWRYSYVERIWNQLYFWEDRPMISSADFAGSRNRKVMASGKIGTDYIYTLTTNNTGRVMMAVTLDHNTNMHIIAIGSRGGLGSKLGYGISLRRLEPVSLEGDFPEHFRMWCTKDKQMEVRQVFGPETMAQFVELCRKYNIELYDDNVYISVAESANDATDSTTMVTDITKFVTHNHSVFDHLK